MISSRPSQPHYSPLDSCGRCGRSIVHENVYFLQDKHYCFGCWPARPAARHDHLAPIEAAAGAAAPQKSAAPRTASALCLTRAASEDADSITSDSAPGRARARGPEPAHIDGMLKILLEKPQLSSSPSPETVLETADLLAACTIDAVATFRCF